MKRLLSLALSVVLVMLSVVIVSAAGTTKFNVNIVSETDTDAVISLDFEGGTGFCAMDTEITVNTKKLKVVSVKSGKGFENFKAQTGMAMEAINDKVNPILASAILINPFRAVDGKDIFVVTLKKLSKDKITNNDFKVVITNCADSNASPIATSLTSGLAGSAVATTTTTSAASNQPSTPASQPSEGANSSDEQTMTNAVQPNTSTIDAEDGATAQAADGEEKKAEDAENNKLNPIVIVAIAVGAVAIAVVAAIIVTKKRKSSSDTDVNKAEE